MEEMRDEEREYLENALHVIAQHEINLTEEDVLDLIQIKKRWYLDRGLEAVNECGRVSKDFYNAQGWIEYPMWKRVYDLGYVTQLIDVLDLTRELRELDNKLFDLKGTSTIGNLYFTKGTTNKTPSYFLHNHDYHVIVKPLYGSALWMVGDVTAELSPPDVLMVPSGVEHAVIKCTEPRLSLTLNLSY